MKQEIVLHEPRPQELTDTQVKMIANTEFVPKDKRGNVPAIWAAIYTGRARGIDDMTAIQEIHVIDGSPSYSAALLTAKVHERGHKLDGKISPTQATAQGTRADNGAQMSYTFTLEDAERAGLAKKRNWQQYPAAMCWARAVTMLCRALFSDCFLGGVYTREELDADYEVTADELMDEPGGLTEPGIARAPTEAVARPAVSGSASSWAAVVETFGEDRVRAKKQELFGDTAWKAITQVGIEELVDALKTEEAAIA